MKRAAKAAGMSLVSSGGRTGLILEAPPICQSQLLLEAIMEYAVVIWRTMEAGTSLAPSGLSQGAI